MYICLCQPVTDRQIRQAVDEGCSSLRQLRKELGCCGDCGRCAKAAKAVLQEALEEKRATARDDASLGGLLLV